MGLQAIADTFKGARGKLFAATVAVPLGFAAAFTPVAANDARAGETRLAAAATPISNLEAGRLGIRAREYSKSGKGVAILAFIGNEMIRKGWTLEATSDRLEQIMEMRHGTKAKVFVAATGEEGSSFTLLTRSLSIGPDGINKTIKTNMEQAAQQFKLEQKFSPPAPANK